MINFIKKGKNTSDATATSNDIIAPKTAYVNGKKIIGNIIPTMASTNATIYDNPNTILTRQVYEYENFPQIDIIHKGAYIAILSYVSDEIFIDIIDSVTLKKESSFSCPRTDVTPYEIQGLAINIATINNDYIEYALGFGYNNDSERKTYFTSRRIKYTFNNKQFEFTSPIGNWNYSDDRNYSNQCRVLRDDEVPSRFYFTMQSMYYREKTCVRVIQISYASTDCSSTTGYYQHLHDSNYTIFESTGDSKWIRTKSKLLYLNKTTLTGGTWDTSNVFLSNTMKYMVSGGNLYKITNSDDYNTINANKVLLCSIPNNYTNIYFSKDDTYMIHKATNIISIYKITKTGISLIQTFNTGNVIIRPFFNDTLFAIYELGSGELSIIRYFEDSSDTIKLNYKNSNFVRIFPENVPDSQRVLEDYTFIDGNGNVTAGTMPNNGELNYTPSEEVQIIPAGYTSGGEIEAVTSNIDSNIVPENIKSGVTILRCYWNLYRRNSNRIK